MPFCFFLGRDAGGVIAGATAGGTTAGGATAAAGGNTGCK